jgi:hypothetical protein
MQDDKIDESIRLIEEFFFNEEDIERSDEDYKTYNKECGEKLFIDFAKKYKKEFMNCKLNKSTENKFE